MNSFPVRLFHSVVTGVFAGLILMLVVYHVQGRFLRQSPAPDRIVDIEPAPPPAPAPTPVATDPPGNPDDAIPNDWEIQFHHDPTVNDAGQFEPRFTHILSQTALKLAPFRTDPVH